MLLDMPEDHWWVWIVPTGQTEIQMRGYKTEGYYSKHHGKWLVYGSKGWLENLSKELDTYVETGLIESAKYSKKEPEFDHLPKRKSNVLCVYCYDKEKDFVKRILSEIGVRRVYWKYDWKTVEDWSEKGRLWKEAVKTGGSLVPEKLWSLPNLAKEFLE